jgi:hypothetical protein
MVFQNLSRLLPNSFEAIPFPPPQNGQGLVFGILKDGVLLLAFTGIVDFAHRTMSHLW